MKNLENKKYIKLIVVLSLILVGLGVFLSLSIWLFTADQWKILAQSTWETLLQTIISTVLAYLAGIPVGVLLNITAKNGLKPNKIINFILGLVVNILRSIPCLILVVVCMPWTRAWFLRGTGEWYTILIPLFVTAFEIGRAHV